MKHFIVAGVMAVGFLGFIVGVPSREVVFLNTPVGPQPTGGYFGYCTDKNSGCEDLSIAIYHCGKNDQTYNYPNPFPYFGTNGVDQSFCQRLQAAEAFGILAIVFSFAAVWGAIFHKYTHRHAGSTSSLLASLFGIIALAVYFDGNWQAVDGNDNTVAKAVNSNTLKLGYSTGLQIVGVICSFFGGLLSIVAGKF